MDNEPTSLNNKNDANSLEDNSTIIEPSTPNAESSSLTSSIPVAVAPDTPQSPQDKNASKSAKNRLKQLIKRFNIYLLLFLIIILISVVVIVVAVLKNRKASVAPSVSTQTLTQKQLEQLANSDVSVGNSKQILNVQSNAVFAGQVLVRQDLEVAGTIKAGGSLNLPGISVSGTSTFSQIQTGALTVSGATAFQGRLTASGGLNVSGTAVFSGSISAAQVTVNALTLNGDLSIDHHIAAGGTTPGRTSGGALGNGGTASVSGSDTAGSVSVNTGTSPAAGCFITITFSTKFNNTPHTVVTPVGSAAGGLSFYVDRTTTSMTICSAATPPANASFGFDYIAFD